MKLESRLWGVAGVVLAVAGLAIVYHSTTLLLRHPLDIPRLTFLGVGLAGLGLPFIMVAEVMNAHSPRATNAGVFAGTAIVLACCAALGFAVELRHPMATAFDVFSLAMATFLAFGAGVFGMGARVIAHLKKGGPQATKSAAA